MQNSKALYLIGKAIKAAKQTDDIELADALQSALTALESLHKAAQEEGSLKAKHLYVAGRSGNFLTGTVGVLKGVR